MTWRATDEQEMLRDGLRRFLAHACPRARVRAALEGRDGDDTALWRGLADMGVLGAAIAEDEGGAGLGYLELCIVSEELGRVLSPAPVSSSVYLFAEILKAAGDDAQRGLHLPLIASGPAIGALAHVEPDASRCETFFADGKVSGFKDVVAHGMCADRFVVLAHDGAGSRSLFLVRMDGGGVTRTPVETIDPTGRHARLTFDAAPAERLGAVGEGAEILERVFDRAAILLAFEQIGGAAAALEDACAYAKARFAFGRPIGSFQAVKHMLAEMYVSLALARANAMHAAEALASSAPELAIAAAAARVSASRAFQHCAADNIQTHGGAGFMWDTDCHLFYRRAHNLALMLGSTSRWEAKLVARMAGVPPAAASDDAPAHTVADAEFRAEARAWIAANAPLHLGAAIDASPVDALELGEDAIAAQKAWQRRKFDGGWACPQWPRAYGGRDATPAQRIIWHEEEGCYARLSALFHNGQGMCAPTLMAYASEAQKRDLLPRIASGEDVWCQLFSEPGAGSDLAGVRTRAQRDGDAWRITGQKVWTSGAQHAQWGLLIARSDVDVPKHKGLTAFFVDMHAHGVEVRPIRQMNDRLTFNEVFLTDVRVPDAQRLGAVGDGWRVALTTLMNERLSIGLEMPTGFADLFAYCRTASCDTGPALADARVCARLADFAWRDHGLRHFVSDSLTVVAHGGAPGPENAIVKLAAGRLMQEIATFALDLQGEHGLHASPDTAAFAARFQAMLMRAPATRVEGGADEILRTTIGERVLGLPQDLRADKDMPFSAIPTGA